MIKTRHQVFYLKKGIEQFVKEFETMREAKTFDKQMETVLEDIFIGFAANPEGLKRAMRGMRGMRGMQ